MTRPHISLTRRRSRIRLLLGLMALAALMTIAVTGVRALRGDPHVTPVDACALVTEAEARTFAKDAVSDPRKTEPRAAARKTAACRWRAEKGSKRRPTVTVTSDRWTPASRFRSGGEEARQAYESRLDADGGEELDGVGDAAYVVTGEGERPTVRVVARHGNVILRLSVGPIPAKEARAVQSRLNSLAAAALDRLP